MAENGPSRNHVWRTTPWGKHKLVKLADLGRWQEEKLDSYSDPPDESLLYGESLVIEGERVGEWTHADKDEPDAVTIAYGSTFILKPPTEEERAALIERQHREWEEMKERERLAEEAERNDQWREVHRALKKMHERDEAERVSLERRWRIRRGEYDSMNNKLAWPFGPPLRQKANWKPKRYVAPRPEGWTGPEPEILAPPSRILRTSQLEDGHHALPEPRPLGLPVHRPRPVVEPPPRPSAIVLTDKDGIDHIVPLAIYEQYGREAILMRGVDPPTWVLYRLGFGWNE